MARSLDGKVVAITGSTRGIGRAMAEACAAAGATVVVSSRTPAAVDETVAALRAAGGSASGVTCDVTRSEDLEALLAHAIATHGGVDVWVNNAGMSLGMLRHLDTMPEEDDLIVRTNLLSVMNASRLAVRYFVERRGGVLVNVSGRGGRGDASAYTAAYAATKAGVMVFTKSLAAEHKNDPVTIVAFMPGMVETDFYGESMRVGPGLEPMVEALEVVLDAIGTPIEMVGPKLVEVACITPGEKSGTVADVNPPLRMMRGGMRLAWARMTGKLKSL
jgi:NAD(P)-dependent dehydrogenase (short-subunit alcohol dehydrogenase family)